MSPRILEQIVLYGLLDALVLYEDVRIHGLVCRRVKEVCILVEVFTHFLLFVVELYLFPLKNVGDYLTLICDTTLYHHWLVHQLFRDWAQKVLRDREVFGHQSNSTLYCIIHSIKGVIKIMNASFDVGVDRFDLNEKLAI